tara:strand:+ start:452 stop:658 length:207 start_codon:yes stop_codon:yes gene_type:complete
MITYAVKKVKENKKKVKSLEPRPFTQEHGQQEEQEEEHNPSSFFLKDYRSRLMDLVLNRQILEQSQEP